jgi:hypothetical protein
MALGGTGGARVSIERGVVEVRREEERKGGKGVPWTGELTVNWRVGRLEDDHRGGFVRAGTSGAEWEILPRR